MAPRNAPLCNTGRVVEGPGNTGHVVEDPPEDTFSKAIREIDVTSRPLLSNEYVFYYFSDFLDNP